MCHIRRVSRFLVLGAAAAVTLVVWLVAASRSLGSCPDQGEAEVWCPGKESSPCESRTAGKTACEATPGKYPLRNKFKGDQYKAGYFSTQDAEMQLCYEAKTCEWISGTGCQPKPNSVVESTNAPTYTSQLCNPPG